MSQPNSIILDDVATKELPPILEKLAQLAEADALQLSGLPVTWQYVADGLGTKEVPWFVPFAATSSRWVPAFRAGAVRKSALTALALLRVGGSRAEAARYLLTHFSGEALLRLRSKVAHYYTSPSQRLRQTWWPLLPIADPKDNVVTAFMESRAAADGTNASSVAQRAASYLTKELSQRLNAFFDVSPPRADSGAESKAPVNGLFFSLSGPLSLSPALREPLRLRMGVMAAKLISSVEFADQRSVTAIAAHLGKHIGGEYLHAAHREFGKLQQVLFGSLVMSGFPLLYWYNLANGSKQTAALPNGRRQEFVEAECAAIYNSLFKIFDGARVSLETSKSKDINGRLGITKSATTRAGALCFNHISALRLFAWVDACNGLLDDPNVHGWLNGQTIDDARADCARFSAASKEINSFLHVILARNHGLAGTIHTDFIRKNDSFNGSHESRDVASLVREEMMKAAASFDYTTGYQFSTYAVNRVNFELRRRPHQERQLIKLSPDQTTAQPRVWQLALESDLDESDPEFFRDLADRYNETYSATGRSPISPSQAEDLLRSRRLASVTPSERDDDDSPGIQLADNAPTPVTEDVMKEIAGCVRKILDGFAPAEELALSILTHATPPGEALSRINCSHLADTQTRISKLIASRASRPPGTGSGLAGRKVRITAGQMSEKAIRTKVGEEQMRKERRSEVEVADGAVADELN